MKSITEHSAATTLPPIGAPWPGLEGSVYAGVSTEPSGCIYALVLLADKPAADLAWKQAIGWAKDLAADLPTRAEGALLFQNVRGQFAKRWHWLSESYESDGSFAWSQGFYNGGQRYDHKDNEFGARAVRRFAVQSFSPLEA